MSDLTRRNAILAALCGVWRLMTPLRVETQDGVFFNNSSILPFVVKGSSLTINMVEFHGINIIHGDETITLTGDEIFAALKKPSKP